MHAQNIWKTIKNPLGMLCLKTQGCIWQFFRTCLELSEDVRWQCFVQGILLLEYIPMCLPKTIIQKFKLWPVQTQDMVNSSISKKQTVSLVQHLYINSPVCLRHCLPLHNLRWDMGKPSLRSESLPVVASLLPGSPLTVARYAGKWSETLHSGPAADQTIGLYYTIGKLSSSRRRSGCS